MTGFADEAGPSIDIQIKATKELGWKNIEMRSVQAGEGKPANLHDISDRDFDVVARKLELAGVQINCFGSAIANWGKKIDEPFDSSLAEVRRAIPRMKRLGTKLIRIMSFAVREQDDQMEEERFRRLRELLKMFNDEGLTPVHENCMNYGGMSWRHTLKLIENVPGLKLVFDTGNPIFTDDRSKPKPHPKQSAWEFYDHVKEHIAYIHIKDGRFDDREQKSIFSFPGEGVGEVRRIMKDLIARGYEGGISIEPHLAVVFHDETKKSSAEIMYSNYVEYGRRMMKMIEEIKKETGKK
ncbi:MAG: TIM barrel protein [Verrucomicrobiae bacterium]|nr:TIM barrel protein [Verrucomicrobiae bacterium]